MPISPNNLQFSLSSEYLDKLKSLSKDGESLGLTAKRILIEALDGSISGETISKEDDSRLTALESSVQAFLQIVKNHDSQLTDLFNETIEYEHYGDEIKKVNDRIQAVEIAIDCQHYGDEVKELRGQVDELRKLVYQLTSPVKKR
jgi:hypothetical protein